MPGDPRRSTRSTRSSATAAAAAAEVPPPPPPAEDVPPPPPPPPAEAVPPPPPPPPQPVLFPPPPPPAGIDNILFGGEDAMDEEDEDVDMMDANMPRSSSQQQQQLQFQQQLPHGPTDAAPTVVEPIALPTRILTPSPYPQHTRGPSSARFRNALSRVTTHPTSDSEAWAALLTEVQTCWRQLQPQLHLPSAVVVDPQVKLDFLVSCYAALLQYFPYAAPYWVQLGDILLEASARPGEPGGPTAGTTADLQRCGLAEGHLESVLRTCLNHKSGPEFGVVLEQDNTSMEHAAIAISAKATSEEKEEQEKIQSLSFLQPQQHHPPKGSANTATETTMIDGEEDPTPTPPDDNINSTVAATSNSNDDELTKVLGGMGSWSIPLWILYLKKVHRDLHRHVRTLPSNTMDAAARQKWLRNKMVASYELAVKHAGFGYNNHMIWNDYLGFVKSWTASVEDLDPLVQQQQMIQLRSVYQRLIQLPMTGLDSLWNDYEAFERSHSEELASALLQEYTPKYQHARTVYLERARVYNYTGDLLQLGRLATPPVTRRGAAADAAKKGGAEGEEGSQKETLEDYLSNLKEEYHLLQAWKKRVSYERTNPERLSASDLPRRMRNAHLEMMSVLTRHPEVWHMWSMYEYHHAHKPVRAMAILQLGLQHIPDCTLLAHSQAQLVESYCSVSSSNLALTVMEQFLQTSPNTLAFCLYQQMVRRYQGMQPARVVFAKARRVLTGELDSGNDGGAKEGEEAKEDGADEGGGEDGNNASSSKKVMVTNRLDPSVGRRRRRSDFEGTKSEPTDVTSGGVENGAEAAPKVDAGPITWHLYASHATMEHRLNHLPEIAARIYELGLRNHPHFLTQPPFVLRYAQLLLELNDTVNLRALLTRAVAAVTDEDGTASGPKASVAAVLWDMTLQFETILSGADPMASQLIQDVERKRHMALMGPDTEDVATGGYQLESAASTTIGAQKTTISEQLIRNDGYDVSSTLVNGMGRSVSVLEVMGLWGSNVVSSGVSIKQRGQPNKGGMDLLEDEENVSERSGGASDASYQRRLLYQRLYESGVLQGGSGFGVGDVSAGAGSGAAGNKILSARERMATAGGAGGTNAAISIAIQQQPEWIRPLLLMLPASKMRMAVLTRPPPHLTEMAFLQLRQHALPAERPQDDNGGTAMSQRSARISGQKRSANGGDSSDEDDSNVGGGGYGIQFRSRQRARQMLASGAGDPEANQ